MGERNGTCWDLLGLRWECCGPGRLERPDLEKASSKTRFSLCWATRASEESGKPLLCASGCGRDGSGPSPEDADSERWYRRLRMPHFCDRTGFERNREKRLLYRNAASGVSWSRMTECASVRVDQNWMARCKHTLAGDEIRGMMHVRNDVKRRLLVDSGSGLVKGSVEMFVVFFGLMGRCQAINELR